MISKRDRFSNWRKEKANDEERYIATAELYNTYMAGIKDTDTLKTDLGDTSAQKYKELEQQYGKRSLGAVLFAKLSLEEFIEQLPKSEAEKHKPLSDILSQLTAKFKDIYENPATLKKNEGKGITQLIDAIQSLIQLDDSVFVDKQHRDKLFLTLYALLRIASTTLNAIANATWRSSEFVIKPFISKYITDDTMKKISNILTTIEDGVKTFDPKPAQKTETAVEAEKAFDSHFNARYLSILEGTAGTAGKLVALENEMTQVSKNLVDLDELIKEREQIRLKITAVDKVLNAAKKNDELVSGRAYFLDFINTHQQDYKVFLDCLNPAQKAAFLEKVAQLSQAVKERALSSTISYGLSWLSAPATWAFRQLTPQGVQDSLVGAMPATLDSECKAEFRKLAAACLSALNKELLPQKEEQINAKEKELLINDNSPATLLALQKATDAALGAVKSYSKILKMVEENATFLKTCQAEAAILTDFVSLNNTFLVKLSNFFAHISSIFKTDTARMVDRARACKIKAEGLGQRYQTEVNQCIQSIEADPNVAKGVKEQLKQQFEQVVSAATPKSMYNSKLKQSIHLLVCKLENTTSSIPTPEADEERSSTFSKT